MPYKDTEKQRECNRKNGLRFYHNNKEMMNKKRAQLYRVKTAFTMYRMILIDDLLENIQPKN